MPNEEFARPKRPVEKRGREDEELQKKKMAEFRSDFLDELLANFEFARTKEYVEKRSREAAQAQATVTQVDTVQHSSPCSLNPEPSSSVLSSWRTPRVRRVRSWRSSNHHQLIRVSKRPDSSVPRTRGYGRLDKLPPPAS